MKKNNASEHHTPPPLYSLLYTSTAARPLTQGGLASLLRVARRRNAQLGITGMLNYTAPEEASRSVAAERPDGSFWQYIEGPKAHVRSLFYDRIAQDPQHTSTVVHEEGPAQHRLFPGWDMAFKHASEAELKNLDTFLLEAQL